MMPDVICPRLSHTSPPAWFLLLLIFSFCHSTFFFYIIFCDVQVQHASRIDSQSRTKFNRATTAYNIQMVDIECKTKFQIKYIYRLYIVSD